MKNGKFIMFALLSEYRHIRNSKLFPDAAFREFQILGQEWGH